MYARLIGIGAAGNKAAITAVQTGVIDKENVLLINSTLKDIPSDYDGNKYCFNNSYGGCGKERNISRNYMLSDLQNGDLDLSKFLKIGQPDQAELVVLVSSTEGGTGSGSVPILAKYILEVYGISVRCFSFIGFSDDSRGLRNTVEYFKELEDSMAVESVSNLKYLDLVDGDKIKAEKLANQDFCLKLSIILGNLIRDSNHNIDPTDHLKIVKTPNYSVVEYKEFTKIKNKKEFRELIKEMIDSSKSIDLDNPTQRRVGIIINIDESNTSVIDTDLLEEYYGTPFEKFQHIQYEDSMPQFVAFISTGINMPVKEIEEIFNEYTERSNKIKSNTKESFFTKANDFVFNDDEQFNLQRSSTKTANEFFKNLGANKTAAPSIDENY